MLSVNVLRLRARALPTVFSNSVFKFTQHPASRPVSGVRGSRLTVTQSLLVRNKMQSDCPSTRFISMAPPCEQGNLIYTGNLGLAVRGVKMFSYSTSATALFLVPQMLLKSGIGVQSFALQAAFCGVVGFFTFLSPIFLHIITKGYIIRLYHNPDKDVYTAVTYSVFLTEKTSVFHQRQVRIPAISKMFTTFYAGQAGFLVNPGIFSTPHDYNHLMGYDKPFSFRTDDMDQPDKS